MLIGSWLRTRKKQIVTHTLIVGGFLFFLLFLSEPLFVRFEPISTRSTLQEITLPTETGNIHYSFDRVDSDENTISIIGIAFINGLNTKNSHVFVSLKSDSDNYVFNTFVIPRLDVTENFAYLNLNLDLSGYRAVIPLEEIEDGTYRVGIFIMKDNTEALRYTDMIIKKFGQVVEFPLWTSKPEEISLPKISEPMNFCIDDLEEVAREGKEYTEVYGWAFIEGQNPEQSQTYVVFNSTSNIYIFDTWRNYTPWVPTYFGITDLGLEWAGFIARIPEEEIEDGIYEVGIYIKKGEIEALQYTDNVGNQHLLTMPFLH